MKGSPTLAELKMIDDEPGTAVAVREDSAPDQETSVVTRLPYAAPVMPLDQLGMAMARSGFFADSKDASQAIVKIQAGRELGLPPVASMTGIHIVKGRVTISATTMAGLVKRSAKYNYRVTEHTDTVCRIQFFEGGQPVGESVFTAKDAQTAKLSGDNWRNYPRNMMFARAMSNGVKWYCADVFGGPIYTPEEMGVAVDAGGTPLPQQSTGDGDFIGDGQKAEIKRLLDESGADVAKFLKWLAVDEVALMTTAQYPQAVAMLKKKITENAGGAK